MRKTREEREEEEENGEEVREVREEREEREEVVVDGCLEEGSLESEPREEGVGDGVEGDFVGRSIGEGGRGRGREGWKIGRLECESDEVREFDLRDFWDYVW